MSAPIIATRVVEEERLAFLPRHTGKQMMAYENAVYDRMTDACKDYNGGLWAFYELSNGGFFMAPDSGATFEMRNIDNYFEGTMGAQAAGIAVNLIVQNAFAWQRHERQFADAFHALRDFALGHEEASAIMGYID